MKRAERRKRDAENALAKIKRLVRHIKNVQDNCLILGEKLIEKGELTLGRDLIARGFLHDNSKFFGIEWDTLSAEDKPQEESAKVKLRYAIQHHAQVNNHHPEYFGGIEEMDRLSLCELVCDWKARSEEFGTDFRNWIKETATQRFGFTENDKIFKEIMGFVDLLCDKPFVEPSTI